jgi:biopolymer transport protein ExbD
VASARYGGYLFESVYPLVACTTFLVAVIWIWAWTPVCTLGQPSLPVSWHSDFLATRGRVFDVTLTNKGFLYFERIRTSASDLPGMLISAKSRHPSSRLNIAADAALPFSRLREALNAARAAGFESAILLTGRPRGWPILDVIPRMVPAG